MEQQKKSLTIIYSCVADGYAYVSSSSGITRHNPTTGALVDTFATTAVRKKIGNSISTLIDRALEGYWQQLCFFVVCSNGLCNHHNASCDDTSARLGSVLSRTNIKNSHYSSHLATPNPTPYGFSSAFHCYVLISFNSICFCSNRSPTPQPTPSPTP